MRVATWFVGSVLVVAAVGSVLSDDVPAGSDPLARPVPSPSAAVPAVAPTVPDSPTPVADQDPPVQDLVQSASGGDGDSWRDTAGREYRLGLVNTPEVGECFAAEATAERVALVAGGFRADVYSVDRYGRSVAVVTTADGVDVNVHLARHGFADDRYVAQFRDEKPSLAAELDVAFAAARAASTGLWGACSSSVSPPPVPANAPVTAGCHPDYATCVPVKGDGSGDGGVNDLDCGDLGGRVQLQRIGVDPYRLDGDRDGFGCTSG